MAKKIGKALVMGAGISGIRAALDLAEYGYGVTLIDRSPHIGGILSQLDYQFPTDRCGMCKMLPLVNRDASSQYCLRKGLFHENIDILLSTDLDAIEGEAGQFTVTLRQHPNWIDSERCTGCGDCVLAMTGGICPVTTCPKGILNGPCGGNKKGKCEVSPDVPCAWVRIYEQLKKLGKLDLLEKELGAKDWSRKQRPGRYRADEGETEPVSW